MGTLLRLNLIQVIYQIFRGVSRIVGVAAAARAQKSPAAALVTVSAGTHVRIVLFNFDLTADSVETVLHVVSAVNHL